MTRGNDTIVGDEEARDTDPVADMRAFDTLPPAIRAAMRDHPDKIASEDVRDTLRAGFPQAVVLDRLAEMAEEAAAAAKAGASC